MTTSEYLPNDDLYTIRSLSLYNFEFILSNLSCSVNDNRLNLCRPVLMSVAGTAQVVS